MDKNNILKVIKNDFYLKQIFSDLEQCEFKLDKTEEYTRSYGWGSTWAYLNIICPTIEIKDTISMHSKKLEFLLRDSFDLGENYDGGNYIISINPKLSMMPSPTTTFEPTFEDIENKIINQIKNAKYFIWVSVAWITNQKIISCLNKKAEEGLNVQVIYNDDSINDNNKNYFKENVNLQLFKTSPFGYYNNNIVHHKFAIFDGKTLLQGSYNWSNKANYNKEVLNTITGEEVELYMDEFIKLKSIK